jgi:hypothetical protein
MSKLTRTEHDHVLHMIETMQRNGHAESAIHDAVRRATRGERPERPERRDRRGGLFRRLRRRQRRD